MFRTTTSARCSCAICQQRSRGMQTVRSGSIILLPSDAAGFSAFWQTWIDRESLSYLKQKRVINWCSGTHNLYPMKTAGSVVVLIIPAIAIA